MREEPTIELNKAHYPVTVLGPGRRIGLWLQGCSIGCKGCVSQDTWPQDPTRRLPISKLIAWCQKVYEDSTTGITLSGGEPFDQAPALEHLLTELARWRATLPKPLDILCYSGYTWTTLQRGHANILARLDGIIPEPFVAAKPSEHAWRGSSNQSLIALTPLGRERYADADAHATGGTAHPSIQISVESGRVWMIGIPQRGDTEKLEALCQASGLTLNQVSWRR